MDGRNRASADARLRYCVTGSSPLRVTRFCPTNPVMRAELLGVATINLFNFVYWALFLLYASRYLHVSPATIGVVILSRRELK